MKTKGTEIINIVKALLIVFIFLLIFIISIPLYMNIEKYIYTDETINIENYSSDSNLKATDVGHWFNRSFGGELYSIKNVPNDKYIVKKDSYLNEVIIKVYKNNNLNEKPLSLWSIKEIGIYFNNSGGNKLDNYYIRNDLSLFDEENTIAIADFLKNLDYSDLQPFTYEDETIGYFRVAFSDMPFVWDSYLYYDNEGFYILYEDKKVVFPDSFKSYFFMITEVNQ